MNHSRASIGLIVAALAATIAFYQSLEAQATEKRRVVVEIRKLQFDPPTLAVSPGDIVVWKNMDIVPHTATSKDETWTTDTIEAGGESETIVTADMLREYFCRFHPSMVATLDVRSD